MSDVFVAFIFFGGIILLILWLLTKLMDKIDDL